MTSDGTAAGAHSSDSGPEIELIGSENEALTTAASATLEHLEVTDGHVAIEIVDAARIQELNLEHRAKDIPTDVLSFPVDGEGIATGDLPEPDPDGAPVELGDVVICPEHTTDMVEATVHGVLHLCGFDHETDDGEMLALQDEIVEALAGGGAA